MHVNIGIIARTARSAARCGASTRGVSHRCRLQCTELPPLKRPWWGLALDQATVPFHH